MLKFMDTITESDDIDAVTESINIATYFGIDYDPAEEAVSISGIKEKVQNFAAKIKKWIVTALNAIKKLFLNIARLDHGTIDTNRYKYLMDKLKDLNSIDYKGVVTKLENAMTSPEKIDSKLMSEISELRSKVTAEVAKVTAEPLNKELPAGSDKVVSFKGLNSEKSKFGEQINVIQGLVTKMQKLSTESHGLYIEVIGTLTKLTAMVNKKIEIIEAIIRSAPKDVKKSEKPKELGT